MQTNRLKNRCRALRTGFCVLLLPISTSWIADGLDGDCLWTNALTCPPLEHALRVAGAVALAVIALVGLWSAARHLLIVHRLQPGSSVKPHRVLIAAVSTLNSPLVAGEPAIAVAKHHASVRLSGALHTDIDAISTAHRENRWEGYRWNGQQLLRAISPHLPTLQQVILLGSSGRGGSQDQLDDYQRLLRLYLPQIDIDIGRASVDFEDINAMTHAFAECIDAACLKGYAERDIMIDVTGGQKTASIAAALSTLSRPGLEFQYVQTSDNFDVRSFNVVAKSRANPGNT